MRKITLLALLLAALLLAACVPSSDPQPTTYETAPPQETPGRAQEDSLYYYNADRADEYLKAGELTEAVHAYEAAIRYAMEEGRSPEELTNLYLRLHRAYDLQGKHMRSLAVLLGAREHGAKSGEVDGLIAELIRDAQPGAAKAAYREALQALLAEHGQAAATEDDLESYPVGVFYADFIDCDRDGTPELLCIYGAPETYTYTYEGVEYEDIRNVPHVALYAYDGTQAARVLDEGVGYSFAQSDEGKEVHICVTKEGVWLNFYVDSEDYCSAYYSVEDGRLVSHVLRAALPAEESFDVSDSVYDVALDFTIDGAQATREAFEQESRRLREQFYGPGNEAYDDIYIPLDEFWALGYARQVEAVMLTLDG